jgi:uncharacterized protein (DUF433 family)/DNA-binding transcriptional MerR regulator
MAMAFPLRLTSVLTGATTSQLLGWRAKGLVVPEVRPERPPLYSFRDLVLLRSMVYLRSNTSLQNIGKAWRTLDMLDLAEHPSKYRFWTDGKTIVADVQGDVVDLVKRPGQRDLFSFEDIYRSFPNFKNEVVPDFRAPAPGIEVRYQRMGGWPTIQGTRVPYDVVANLVDYKTVMPEDIPEIYPGVSAKAAEDAVSFDRTVQAVAAS